MGNCQSDNTSQNLFCYREAYLVNPLDDDY